MLGISTGTTAWLTIPNCDVSMCSSRWWCVSIFYFIFLFLAGLFGIFVTRTCTWTSSLTTGYFNPSCSWIYPCMMAFSLEKDFDLETDLVLSQVPEATFTQMSEGSDHPPDNSRLSLKGHQKFCIYTEDRNAKKRFSPPVGAVAIKKLQESSTPRNTKKDTAWSFKVYTDWMNARNETSRKCEKKDDDWGIVPPLSASLENHVLDYWLQRFVVEVRRRDGSPYPAVTLKHLCAGLQRHMREVFHRPDVCFFEGSDFWDFRKTLDARMKELNKEGIHTHPKQAQPLSIDDESVFWDKGIFNWIDSRCLQNAVYFYTCKVFGLRAADEHAGLTMSQFTFNSDKEGEYIRFQGKVCKNNQGGLSQAGKVAFKDLRQYSQPDNPRCYVKMMKLYMQALPKNGPFYRRPLVSRYCGDIRYSKQKIGIHYFENLMQKLVKDAGLQGFFTGHSGKVNLLYVVAFSVI